MRQQKANQIRNIVILTLTFIIVYLVAEYIHIEIYLPARHHKKIKELDRLFQKGPTAIPFIYEYIDENKETGIYAINLIGRFRDKRALPYLIKLLKSKNSQFRYWAALNIRNIPDPREAVIPLIENLTDDDANESANEISHRVAQALDKICNLCISEEFIGYFPNKQKRVEIIQQVRDWWEENQNYMFWSIEEGYYILDQEAKAAGIPTEEYRKTHPWPKDKEPDKPDGSKQK